MRQRAISRFLRKRIKILAGSLTNLEVLRKPAQEPFTLDEVMDYLHASSKEEKFVRMLLPLSREVLEGKLGVAFYTQQLQATFLFDHQEIELQVSDPDEWKVTLPKPPLQYLDSVEIESEPDVFSVLDEDDYDLVRQFPAEVYLLSSAFGDTEFPWWYGMHRLPRIRITYTCGYVSVSAIPAKYKLFLYQLIGYNFLQREVGGFPQTMDTALLAEKVFVL